VNDPLTSRIGVHETRVVAGEPVLAFVPPALPPVPPIVWTPALEGLLERANIALGRLDGLASLLPDVSIFIYLYIRKEATLSSQIEGTQSSLSDLLLFESAQMPGVPLNDVQEVSRYVAAMTHGLERLRGGFPLSMRLLREIHGVLMSDGRGSAQDPGEFRRSQNWIGGSRPGNAAFVPPPAELVLDLMSDLERFLHDQPTRTPTLVKAALAHVQFETIHPFLDGNGRLGRLLITLLLCEERVLQEPILYLSLYLKTHRGVYYELLQRVRLEGAWEAWLAFFLQGVLETATQAVETSRSILALIDADRRMLEGASRASAALRAHQYLQRKLFTSTSQLAMALSVSQPTALAALEKLEGLGITVETTGRSRDRIWVYQRYLDLLEVGLGGAMNGRDRP
jgi:Fic family protein